MSARPNLYDARKNLLARMRQVVDRVTVHEPPRPCDERRTEELARKFGLLPPE